MSNLYPDNAFDANGFRSFRKREENKTFTSSDYAIKV